VFEKEYRLMPLKQIEKYINRHKYLPEIPDALTVETYDIELENRNKHYLWQVVFKMIINYCWIVALIIISKKAMLNY
jgi:hypothetical protein